MMMKSTKPVRIHTDTERKLDALVYFAFAVLLLVVSIFHEPWFDETQAWQIAKCCSLHDLLFVLPRYEGHPPLWWLILAVPAKLGVPFELGLKAVGYGISLLSEYLILFRAPFPAAVRCLLPFSWFFFYQYGVIVRPYGLMLLVLLLLALEFPQKDVHPYRFCGLLVLLCLTSANGMLLAAGFALCMLSELLREKGYRRLLAGIGRDPRTRALLILLAGALLLAFQIRPYPNTDAVTTKDPFDLRWLPIRIVCVFFSLLSDCFLTNSLWFSQEAMVFTVRNITWDSAVGCVLVGSILLFAIYLVSSRRSLFYFIIPYLLFTAFAALVYVASHHVGITQLLLVFWLWITMQDADRFHGWHCLQKRCSARDQMAIKRFYRIFAVLCAAINLYWTIATSVMDIRGSYMDGRNTAAFFKETGLDQTKIECFWRGFQTPEDPDVNTNIQFYSLQIVAYFDRNIFLNLNNGEDDKAYVINQALSPEQNQENINRWKQFGIPDVLIGPIDAAMLTDGAVSLSDYTVVYRMHNGYFWKGTSVDVTIPIYLRTSELEQYHLQPAPAEEGT